MAVEHRIRKSGKGEVKLVKLTARRAIIYYCRECLGFETNPRDCTAPLCPLYPFRCWDKPVGRY